jgi:hypothetical protein
MEGRKPTSDALEILWRRYYEGKPDRIASLEEERRRAELDRRAYEAAELVRKER